jgi:hypothetical protein
MATFRKLKSLPVAERSLPAAAKCSMVLWEISSFCRSVVEVFATFDVTWLMLVVRYWNFRTTSARVKQSRQTMECYMIFFESRKTGSAAL